jgi:hypothetical protein
MVSCIKQFSVMGMLETMILLPLLQERLRVLILKILLIFAE